MNVKKNPLYYVNVGAFLLLSVYSFLVCINVFDRDNIDMNAGLCAVITAMVVCLMMYVIHVVKIANMLYSNPIMKVALEVISTLIFLTLSCVIRIYAMGEFEVDITYEAAVLGCIVLAYALARILNQFGFITLMLLTPWPYIMSGYDFTTADMLSVAAVFLALCVLCTILYFVRRNKNIKIAIICVILAAIFGYLFYTMHTWNLTSLYVDKFTDYIGLFESMFRFGGGHVERYYYIVCIISAIIGGARMWMGSGSANSIMVFAVNMVYFFTITYGIENAFIYMMYPLLAVVAAGAFGTRPAYMDREVELSDNLGSISVDGNKGAMAGTFVDDSELDKMLDNIEEKKGGYQGRTYGAAPAAENGESQDDVPIELQMYDSLANKAEEEKKAAMKAEEEARRIAEEEAKKQAEEARRAAEEAAKRQAEEARLAAEAEAKRLAEEKAVAEEAVRRAEEEKRIAQQQAETQRLIAEREEAHKAEIARLEAEAAAQRAELQRLAAEREAAKKAEEERLAAEKLAAQKAEAERLAAEAEANRKEAEKLAEERRIAEELAEQTRAKRLAEEKAAVEKAAAERIAAELAAEQAAAARIAAEQAAAKAREERLAAEKAAAEKFESETINTASFEMPDYNTVDKDLIGDISDLVIEEPAMETMETTIKNNAEAEISASEEPEIEEPEIEEPEIEEPGIEEPETEEFEAEEPVEEELVAEFEAEELETEMPEFEAEEPVTEIPEFEAEELETEMPEFEAEELETEMPEFESEELETEIPEFEAEELETEMPEFEAEETETEYVAESMTEPEAEYEAENMAEEPLKEAGLTQAAENIAAAQPEYEESDEFDVDQFASFDNSGFGFDDQAPEFETMGSFMANNSGSLFPQFETGNQSNIQYEFNLPDDVQEGKNNDAGLESSENAENTVQDFDSSQMFASEMPIEEESEAVEVQPEVVMDYGIDVDEDFGSFFGQAQSLTDFYDMDSQPAFTGEFEEVSLSEPEFEAEAGYEETEVSEDVYDEEPVSEENYEEAPASEESYEEAPATEEAYVTETEMPEPEYDNQNSEEMIEVSDIHPDYAVEAESETVSVLEPVSEPEIPTVNPFAKEADYFDWSKVDESEYMEEDYSEDESADEPVKASKNDEYAEFVWTDEMIKELDKNEASDSPQAEETEAVYGNEAPDVAITQVSEEIELPQEEIAATKEETIVQDDIPTLNEQDYVAPEEPAQFAVYQPTGNVSVAVQDEEQVEQPQFEVFQSSGNYTIEEPDNEAVDEPQFEVFESSGNVKEDIIEEIVPEYKTYGEEPSDSITADEAKEPVKHKTQFDDFEFDLDLPDFEPYDSTKK